MRPEYNNYFDNSEYGLAYHSGLEETCDYLGWLDLFLDGYAAISGGEALIKGAGGDAAQGK